MGSTTVVATNEMILKIKKPDYLGESMWEFRHGSTVILARGSDGEWLRQFQTREVQIRPGDSIRAVVQIINKYDFEGELLGTSYEISEVSEVVPMEDHIQLGLEEDNTDSS